MIKKVVIIVTLLVYHTADAAQLKIVAKEHINHHQFFLQMRHAKETNNWEVLEKQFQQCADLTITDPEGRNILHAAICCKAPLNLIKKIIQSGIDINCQNIAGFTPLHTAALVDRDDGKDILLELLETNAKLTITSYDTEIIITAYKKFIFSLLHDRLKASGQDEIIKELENYNAVEKFLDLLQTRYDDINTLIEEFTDTHIKINESLSFLDSFSGNDTISDDNSIKQSSAEFLQDSGEIAERMNALMPDLEVLKTKRASLKKAIDGCLELIEYVDTLSQASNLTFEDLLQESNPELWEDPEIQQAIQENKKRSCSGNQ